MFTGREGQRHRCCETKGRGRRGGRDHMFTGREGQRHRSCEMREGQKGGKGDTRYTDRAVQGGASTRGERRTRKIL
jgi:hypothetical protein